MLTFTSLGNGSLRIAGDKKNLIVFPPARDDVSEKDVKDGVVLLSVPEEERSSENTISWPGEYNESGVSFRGIGHADGQQVSYLIEIDGVRALLLSSPLQDWTDFQIQAVGDIDLLLLPTGDVKLVQKLVDEFDPRVLLYVPNGEGDEGSILKAIGASNQRVSEYKLKGSLPAEGREVVILAK